MRACQAFDRRLQIKIERRPDGAAQSRVLRDDCIHKMWRKVRRIDASDFRRGGWLRLVVERNNSPISKSAKRSRVFTICFLRMPPGIEARWRLRQTGQKDCFSESEIASRFAEISMGGCFRAESSTT